MDEGLPDDGTLEEGLARENRKREVKGRKEAGRKQEESRLKVGDWEGKRLQVQTEAVVGKTGPRRLGPESPGASKMPVPEGTPWVPWC